MDINTKIKLRKVRELNSRRGIFLDLTYIDITGDITCGVLLSQLIYWFSDDEKGNSKLRVKKEDRYWLAKSKNEWYQETRLSKKQLERAEKILKQMGIIEVKIFKFNGTPTNHYWFNWERFIELEEDSLLSRGEMGCAQRVQPDAPKGDNGKLPKGSLESDDKVQPINPKGSNLLIPKGSLDNTETEQSITYTTTNTTTHTTTENTNRESKPTQSPSLSIQSMLKSLKSSLSDVSYNTWIAPTVGNAYLDNDELIIPCPNKFTLDILEKRYLEIVKSNNPYKSFKLILINNN